MGAVLGVLVPLAVGAGGQERGRTERISVADDGAEAELMSSRPSISGDGQRIAFESDASNLVAADTNEFRDVFVRDRVRRDTQWVSEALGGLPGDAPSGEPSISADGRFVAFSSFATNLVEGDVNRKRDVFVRDLATGTTERVSVGPDGVGGDGGSYEPAISGDGRFVAFTSHASNLAPNDDNGAPDVYLRDRATRTTWLVSATPDGSASAGESRRPAISGSGAFVAFESAASDLLPDRNRSRDVFLARVPTAEPAPPRVLHRISMDVGMNEVRGDSGRPSISADGAVVAFESLSSRLVPGDGNREMDVFVRGPGDRLEIASVSSDGLQVLADSSRPALAANGHWVAFQSRAGNLVPGDDNRYCAGTDPDAPPNCPDVFVRDRGGHRTLRVSVADDGSEGNDGTFSAQLAISADGRVVAFTSLASNLVPGDTNDVADVFVRELW